MNNPLRFGLIGCGRIAQRHASIMQQHGVLAAVCDIDKSKADELATQYGAEAFYDAAEMLQFWQGELDVVAVCSPNGLHTFHSISAMRHGAHVLCEKPMAIKATDAEAMLEAARSTGRHLVVVKQNRYNPPVVAVKQMLDSQQLGRILSVQCNCFWNRPAAYYLNTWKGTLDLDGGALYTQFSHFIDILVWMFGRFEPIAAVATNALHQGVIDTDDSGIVMGRFGSGALLNLNYTVNAFDHNMEGSITIFGEFGTVKIGGQYLNELEYQSLSNGAMADLPTGNPPNQYGQYTGSMSNHPMVYQSLMDQLSRPATVTTALQEAATTVQVIEHIYKMAGRQS
jgi:predicted dehydrogenase